MKKIYTFLMLGATALVSSFSMMATDEVITTAPTGETQYFTRSGWAYYTPDYRYYTENFSGLSAEMVTTADGEVYLKDPIAKKLTGSYIVGKKDGEKITFELPQAVENDLDWMQRPVVYTVALANCDASKPTSPKVTMATNQVLTLVQTEDGNWTMDSAMKDGSLVLALMKTTTFDDGSTTTAWGDFADWDVTYTPVKLDLVTPPADATAETWATKYSYTGHFSDVVIDGSDFYIKGLFQTFPNAWVKGTITGATVTIPSGQDLGASATTGDFASFTAATLEEAYNEETERNYEYFAPVENIVFQYDPTLKEISTSLYAVAAVNIDVEQITKYNEALTTPTVAWQPEEVDHTPMAPIMDSYEPYGKHWGTYDASVGFIFPTYNSKGQLIDTENLYYRLLVDEEVYEITPDKYYSVPQMTEIPFSYTGYSIYASGINKVNHGLTFFVESEFVGVQTLYKEGDDMLLSQPVAADASMTIPECWVIPEEPEEEVPEGIIVEAPAGESKIYSRSGSAAYVPANDYRTYKKNFSGLATEIVTTPAGNVYMKNPLSMDPSNSYIHGTIKGNRMTFEFPQIIGEGENWLGVKYNIFAMLMTCSNPSASSPNYRKAENQTMTLLLQEDGSWKMEEMEDGTLVLANAEEDGSWLSCSDWNVTYVPAQGETVKVPDGLVTEQWAAKYANVGHFVEVAADGDDMYVKGLFTQTPEAWIMGTIDGSKVSFPSQFLGVSETTANLLYFTGATEEEGVNEETGRTYGYYAPVAELVFDFNATSRVMETSASAVAAQDVTVAEITAFAESLDAPVIEWQPEEISLTPAKPILDRYTAYEVDRWGDGEGTLEFTLPMYNVNGQLLDPENVYYRFLFDENVLVAKKGYNAGEYYTLPEDTMSEFPYLLDCKNGIFASGAEHTFCFYIAEYDFIGIQALYKTADGENVYGPIEVVTGTMPDCWDNSDAVDAIEASEVAESVYFDLAGRRVANPEKGVYVKVMKLNDGSVKSVKVMR